MANAERGEVDLVSGETRYTLALGHNSICILETRTGKTWGELLDGLKGQDFRATRETLWQALKRHHAAQFSTVESVGDLIDQSGIAAVWKALGELIVLNASKGAEDRPPRAETT